MSKLPPSNQFIDLSDYGRPVAKVIASRFKGTALTPIHMTMGFIIAGLIAIGCIAMGYYRAAAGFLIVKSILDAADGELARQKNTPSYTGRYFDSVSDIILNFLILITIGWTSTGLMIYALPAFIGIQLQGTLYNYYYVILRNKHKGDTTSRIFERHAPLAFEGEKQKHVDVLFRLYTTLYGNFDKFIYYMDPAAVKSKTIPKWFMTAVSVFGLGFQLLIISIMLLLDLNEYIIPYFITYTLLIFVFIEIRKRINKRGSR